MSTSVRSMKAELNISLSYQQILDLVRQLPRRQKIRLTRELEREMIGGRLSQLLEEFRTDDLSDELIDSEVKAVRKKRYERLQ